MKTSLHNWTKTIMQLLAVALLFWVFPSYAAVDQPSAGLNMVMANVLTTIPALVRLVIAVSYVLGIWFIYSAIRSFAKFGKGTAMKPSGASIKPCVMQLVVGSLLLFAPGFIDITTYSLWGYGSTSIIEYSSGAETSMGWGPVLKGAEAIIRLVGYISFVRGLLYFTKLGQAGTKEGTFSKGLTHIIGGILAINIVGTIDIIKASLGL